MYNTRNTRTKTSLPPLVDLPTFTNHEFPRKPELKNFKATAILHPFAPPQTDDCDEIKRINKEVPFYQLCTVYIEFGFNKFRSQYELLAKLTGITNNSWWYKIKQDGDTQVSRDQGITWKDIDYGWALTPLINQPFLKDSATYVGTSPLNWLMPNDTDWWKQPYNNVTDKDDKAAIWIWMKPAGPVRIMYGKAPKNFPEGSPFELPIFQNFSFTWFTSFSSSPLVDITENIAGFSFDNKPNYDLYKWNDNFSIAAFMTPVNINFNPLPTQVAYKWEESNTEYIKKDSVYERAQSTTLHYSDYNSDKPVETQQVMEAS
ncbi:MAG: hypothetical protein HRT38_20830 [Alteromonadaceae bacterium]|nr:hypothetical protein [Alteromonadaceae bacterium]